MIVEYLRWKTAAMDHQKTMWIKKEETDGVPDEPGLMFLEEPLSTEVPYLAREPDPEMKLHIDSSENKLVKDPLGVSWITDFIKEEPGLNLEVDETAYTVVASTRQVSISTRFVEDSDNSCDTAMKETFMEGLGPNELEIRSEQSTHLKTFYTQMRGLEEEEEEEEEEEKEKILFDIRLKCRCRENEFHKFWCNFCLKSFASKYRLIMHVFNHMDGVLPPRYICMSCGEIFSSDIGLNKHLKINEGDEASSAGHSDNIDCIYKHENINLEGIEKFSVIKQTEKESSQRKARALSGTGTRSHKCDVCGKLFTRLHNLKVHALTHTQVRPYKCDICGKSFSQSSHCKIHSLIHSGRKLHKCPVCSKSFTQLGNLKVHLLIHTRTRSYKCDVCGKSFTLLGHLKAHSLIHTGTRSHKCEVCGKSFTLMAHLNNHSLIHTGERPHKCNECGKSFARLDSVKKHALIHTAVKLHKCYVCGISFTQLDVLNSHALGHNTKRTHKCDVCGKFFTTLGNLRMHALIHTGIRAHKCKICEKTFTQLNHLKRHLSIHTHI